MSATRELRRAEGQSRAPDQQQRSRSRSRSRHKSMTTLKEAYHEHELPFGQSPAYDGAMQQSLSHAGSISSESYWSSSSASRSSAGDRSSAGRASGARRAHDRPSSQKPLSHKGSISSESCWTSSSAPLSVASQPPLAGRSSSEYRVYDQTSTQSLSHAGSISSASHLSSSSAGRSMTSECSFDNRSLGEPAARHRPSGQRSSGERSSDRRPFERPSSDRPSVERPSERPSGDYSLAGRSSERSSAAPSAARSSERSSASRATAISNHHLSGYTAPTPPANSMQSNVAPVRMRSTAGMQGLEAVETGGGMVELDLINKRFNAGAQILPQLPPNVSAAAPRKPSAAARPSLRSTSTRVISRSGKDEEQQRLAPLGGEMSRSAGGLPESASQKTITPEDLFEADYKPVDPARSEPGSGFDYGGTLISAGSNPQRRSRELGQLLAPSGRRLSRTTSTLPDDGLGGGPLSKTRSRSKSFSGDLARLGARTAVVLEQSRSGKARVEVDLALESSLVVEGGSLRGRLEIKVRKGSDKNGEVMISQPKIRVVGFEELLGEGARHVFYHHAMVIASTSDPYLNAPPSHGTGTSPQPSLYGGNPLPCFASPPDDEGYCRSKEGVHNLPFVMHLPLGKGAKGTFKSKNAVVRYIIIGSVKLKSTADISRSIAHFYRHIDVYPFFEMANVLAPAPKPIEVSNQKGMFLGGSGKVKLAASMHRSTWVAGQRLYVHVSVKNGTTKKVKAMTACLIRTVTIFRPRPHLDAGDHGPNYRDAFVDADACETQTYRKKISESELELGQKGTKGGVTAKGWWRGVEGGETFDFNHYVDVPPDALSLLRSRHIEVLHTLKVSVRGSLSSDVSVELPVTIINFASIDPPPTGSGQAPARIPRPPQAGPQPMKRVKSVGIEQQKSPLARSKQIEALLEGPRIARVRSLDTLRSKAVIEVDKSMLPPGLPLPGKAPSILSPNRPLSVLSGMSSEGESTDSAGDAVSPRRRINHQMSLECINLAIMSATARRGRATGSQSSSPSKLRHDVRGPSPPITGLGIALPDDADERSSEIDSSIEAESQYAWTDEDNTTVNPTCLPYVHQRKQQPYGFMNRPEVSLDEVGLDSCGEDFSSNGDGTSATGDLDDDSEEEVDLVIGSSRFEEDASRFEEDDSFERGTGTRSQDLE